MNKEKEKKKQNTNEESFFEKNYCYLLLMTLDGNLKME